MPGSEAAARAHRDGTRALLERMVGASNEPTVRLHTLLDDFDERGFGLLLMIGALPAFIPVPVGGAVSGPLVAFLGVQLLLLRRDVWLPERLEGWGPSRESLRRFVQRIGPWLSRLERVVRPRWPRVFDHPAARVASGLLLSVTGVLLALPIPATNFLFGGLVLAFALALLERDGLVLVLAWVVAALIAATLGAFSGELLTHLGDISHAAAASWHRLWG